MLLPGGRGARAARLQAKGRWGGARGKGRGRRVAPASQVLAGPLPSPGVDPPLGQLHAGRALGAHGHVHSHWQLAAGAKQGDQLAPRGVRVAAPGLAVDGGEVEGGRGLGGCQGGGRAGGGRVRGIGVEARRGRRAQGLVGGGQRRLGGRPAGGEGGVEVALRAAVQAREGAQGSGAEQGRSCHGQLIAKLRVHCGQHPDTRHVRAGGVGWGSALASGLVARWLCLASLLGKRARRPGLSAVARRLGAASRRRPRLVLLQLPATPRAGVGCVVHNVCARPGVLIPNKRRLLLGRVSTWGNVKASSPNRFKVYDRSSICAFKDPNNRSDQGPSTKVQLHVARST